MLFGHASIFWHFTGMGVDEERNPESTEHYGISTVEAMSAGCVPVVISKGGQPEIVGKEGAGYLCDTPEECVDATRALAADAVLLNGMSEKAKRRAEQFSYDSFRSEVQRLFPLDS